MSMMCFLYKIYLFGCLINGLNNQHLVFFFLGYQNLRIELERKDGTTIL